MFIGSSAIFISTASGTRGSLAKPRRPPFCRTWRRERRVAAATQGQALAALLFLYKQVLGRDLGWLDGMTRAKRPVRLPTVLSLQEVQGLLSELSGTALLMAGLLYGAGLRHFECLRLRVKDVDFNYRQILVREGKGPKRPGDAVAGKIRGAAARAPGEGAPIARARLARGLRRGAFAVRARAQVPARRL